MELTLEEPSRNGGTTHKSDDHAIDRDQLSAFRDELDDYLARIRGFENADPAHVMAMISSIHARLAHIRVQLVRSGSQRASVLRTKEVDPVMEALEFQFKVHSRIISIAELELKMAGAAS